MAHYFLLAVGYWNLVGSIVLYLMLNPTIADMILRQWTWIITQPYEVGNYGALWLVWAATTNTFFSLINLFAAGWETEMQRVVLYGNVLVYGVTLIASIAVVRHKYYGLGNYFNLGLGLFWIVWAMLALHQIGY